MKEIRWLAAVVMGLICVMAVAAPSWNRLEPGLAREEVREMLGAPLMISEGRGFEVWIYDQQREVVWLRGVVVAWTARDPAVDARGRALDLRGLGKAQVKTIEKKKVYVPRSEENFGYEKTMMGRTRLRAF